MGKVGKGIGRAFGGVGKFFSRTFGGGFGKILGTIIGVVAAVAIPYLAPVISGAIGLSSTVAAGLGVAAETGALIGSTLTGATLGAGAGALSGSLTGNVGMGALLGGLGGAVGGFVGGGGTNALFGSTTPAGAADVTSGAYQGAEAFGSAAGYQGAVGPAIAPDVLPLPPAFVTPEQAAGLASATAPSAAPSVASVAPAVAESGIGSSVTAPATPGATPSVAADLVKPLAAEPASFGSRFMTALTGPGGATKAGAATTPSIFSAEGLGAAVGSVGRNLISPSGLASAGQLAMTMFNKPPEGLTTEERAYLEETRQLAGTNQQLFNERVQAARRLLQQGQANPEQAYAQTQFGVERRYRERGYRSPAEQRMAAIEGARLGALAVPAEQARAAQATQVGLSTLPTSGPQPMYSAAGLNLERDEERRRQQYESDRNRAIGSLLGAIGGSRSSLFA